jgi:shikimate 5-dehydrogenase
MTPFLRAARQRGLAAVPGYEILVHQALGAWELWTGNPVDHREMKQAIFRHLNLPRPSGDREAAAP